MSDSESQLLVLRLYIAVGSPHSVRAQRNLEIICQKHLQPDAYSLEIIDVLTNAGRALEDKILLTPTLLKLLPPPVMKLSGDLSDFTKVFAALGIESDLQ